MKLSPEDGLLKYNILCSDLIRDEEVDDFIAILEQAKADLLANVSHDCRAPEDVCDCNCSKCDREWKIEYVPLSVIEKWLGKLL